MVLASVRIHHIKWQCNSIRTKFSVVKGSSKETDNCKLAIVDTRGEDSEGDLVFFYRKHVLGVS